MYVNWFSRFVRADWTLRSLALGVVLLAQPAAAERWFGTTSVGCFALGDCSAHLQVTELLGDSLSVYFSREAGANAPLELRLRVNKPVAGGVPIKVEVGGKVIDLKPGEDMRTQPVPGMPDRLYGYLIAPHRVAELTALFLAEKEMRVTAPVAGQTLHLTFRLDGLRDALLWIDEWQGRRGAVDAIIDKGERPAADAKVPRALPPAADWPTPIMRIFKRERCSLDLATFDEFKTGFIATPVPGRTVWGIPCEGGNYNIVYLVIEMRDNDPRTARQVWFPSRLGRKESVVINAVWWEMGQELRTYSRDRSLGDCGTVARYRWTNAGVTLVDQRRRRECDDVFIDPWTKWPQAGRKR